MLDLTSIEIPAEVLQLIPKEVATDFHVIPLSSDGETVHVALPAGHDEQTVDDLGFYLGKKVLVKTFSVDLIMSALQRFYDVSEMDLARASVALTGGSKGDGNGEEPLILSLKAEDRKSTLPAGGSVVGTADRIITEAIRMGASDIHIEPYEKFLRVRYRLDGALHEVEQLPIEKSKPLISRIKIISELDIAEKRRPQDGRLRVHEDGRTIDVRVSTLPTDFGEKVVLRILDKSQLKLDLSKLGFEDRDLRTFEKTIRLPYGMILVTGPTGSGKTTTLYAALQHINDPRVNITTIEDPIEYNLVGINQTQVRSEIGVTFAASLRSILRQDPNIIMVGEIRDSETAEIAIRSALTGHLVFSTLHTNDALSAITRLIDMGVEPFLVASSVRMILAQRLLRKLCSRCKMPYTLTDDDKEELRSSGIDSHQGTFYKPSGCPSCNGMGYKGRVAVYEMLPVLNDFSDLISRRVSSSDLRKRALELGMITLREAALKKAIRGETSLEEVFRETAL